MGGIRKLLANDPDLYRILGVVCAVLDDMPNNESPYLDEDTMPVDKRLIHCNVSVRLINTFAAVTQKEAREVMLSDVASFTRREVLRFRNFGVVSLRETEALLQQYGFPPLRRE